MSEIFVFGSNLAGSHGAGSAKAAYESHGAIWGCGIGPQGNSYAIPTKDEFIKSMSLDRIEVHVNNFIRYSNDRLDSIFNVVAIGCGLAGFRSQQIAPMFRHASQNVNLPDEFVPFIPKGRN